jgi:ribose 5-phosphate isomerase RpiB
MIVTARQVEDLYRLAGSNGHVTLPYRARLSPLAHDWLKAKRVAVGYSDVAVNAAGAAAAPVAVQLAMPVGPVTSTHAFAPAPTAPGTFLWWCDGPCGPAKAALIAHEKESGLRALDIPPDAKRIASVIKALAAEVKAARAAGSVLMVQNGAVALVFANRCPSLRAVLGTSLEAVEQGVQQVAANVLVIEYSRQTLQQMKNLLGRFVRGRRELGEDVRRQLEDLASCG